MKLRSLTKYAYAVTGLSSVSLITDGISKKKLYAYYFAEISAYLRKFVVFLLLILLYAPSKYISTRLKISEFYNQLPESSKNGNSYSR